jgi:HEAT repeat protein
MRPARKILVAGLLLALVWAVLAPAASAQEEPPDAKEVEELAGELTTGQKAFNVLTFPFRILGYVVYYPLRFIFYDLWVWLFQLFFGEGGPSISALVDDLSRPEAEVRAKALQKLGELRAADALDEIIGRFSDPDDGVRSEAIRAVVRIGSDRRSGRLINMVESASSWQERAAAVQALGLLREKAAVTAVLGALEDRNWYLRYHAANALGHIGHVAAGPALVRRLGDDEARVRAAAAWALGSIGDPGALPPLTGLLGKLGAEGTMVRSAVINAVGALGGKSEAEKILGLLTGPALKADPFSRGAAAHVLGEMGYADASPLLGKMLLTEEAEGAIFGAAAGLAALGELGPLYKALGDRSPYRRIAGVMGIQRVGRADSVPRLVPLVNDPYTDVRRVAIIALLSLGWKKAMEVLIAQLATPDPQMRLWALQTLKTFSGEDHGLSPEAWRTWWKENADGLDLKRFFPRPGKPKKKLSRRDRRLARRLWARHRNVAARAG